MAEAESGNLPELSGPQRAAVLLMVLGEGSATKIFQQLDPREVQLVGQAMSSMPRLTQKEIETIVESFIHELEDESGLSLGASDYMRNVLSSALGADKAEGILERITAGEEGADTRNLAALKWMDARAVAEIVRHEHPQIIATVLSHLDGDQSAEVLGLLPENMRSDIVMRVATLERIPPSALSELNEVMEQRVAGDTTFQSSKVGGVQVAANILGNLEGSTEETIMEDIRESDEELGDRIEDLMFVFEDLLEVEDRSMQTLMREVNTETLTKALKGADTELKEKFFSNMSSRAAEMLRDDLEAMGPVKLSDVEGAQKEILATAKRLEESGEITLGGGEDYV